MKHSVTPRSRCPYCGYKFDRATCVSDLNGTPKPGDVTCCMKCGEVLIFNPNMRAKKPTVNELIRIQHGTLWPLVERTRHTILRFHAERKL